MGVAFIDLQLDRGDVNCYFCTKTHECVAKKSEHTICVGERGRVFVCMRDVARRECRPEPEQNQEEEESGPAPSFMKPAHRTESPSPQMTCFYSLLRSLFILLLLFSFPSLLLHLLFLCQPSSFLISHLFASSDVPLLLFLLHRYRVCSLSKVGGRNVNRNQCKNRNQRGKNYVMQRKVISMKKK